MSQETVEFQPRILLVGAGAAGRELARRLAAQWPISVIDLCEQKLTALAEKADHRQLQTSVGDGTSRLVLERAGAASADHVVAATNSDDVNLEICRVARESFGKSNLYALVANAGRLRDYQAAGVYMVSPAYAAAVHIENRIVSGGGTSLTISEARGEAIEVTVMPSSSVIGRPLGALRSRQWHVAAIYRHGQLVVPTGQTVVEADDRVILIGAPSILRIISEYFRMGAPEFPLQFGSKVMGLVKRAPAFESVADELAYFLKHIRTQDIQILFKRRRRTRKALDASIGSHGIQAALVEIAGRFTPNFLKRVASGDCGCLVFPHERFGLLERMDLQKTLLADLFRRLNAPIIIFRNSYPYQRILIPVTDSEASMRVARMALDLARMFDATVTAVTVTAPRFVVGEEAIQEQKSALKKVTDLATLYRMRIEEVHLEGNPIEEILKIAKNYHLMVVAHRKERKPSFFNPDVSLHLLWQSPITTLALPF